MRTSSGSLQSNKGCRIIYNARNNILISLSAINAHCLCHDQGRRVNFLFEELNFYLRLGSILFNFIWGACTLYNTECIIIFARLNFMGGGGLKPPSPNDAPPLPMTVSTRTPMHHNPQKWDYNSTDS